MDAEKKEQGKKKVRRSIILVEMFASLKQMTRKGVTKVLLTSRTNVSHTYTNLSATVTGTEMSKQHHNPHWAHPM